MTQGRAMLIEELNLMHLPELEQNEILDQLGEVLLQRVLLKLLDMLPENERDNFGKLFASQDAQGMQAVVSKYVPHVDEVIRAELRAGIDEHKRLVNEAAAKEETAQAA
ncbi:MAG: hypothetical protein G01um10148_1062 [Parcubacteria group bacterium Gr01-1014_8]|nr:MAG: hypothetical protein G01um10148_1062 [Parcubacteria group bacterium Gr01-1014_8]